MICKEPWQQKLVDYMIENKGSDDGFINFGVNGRNQEVVDFMVDLRDAGLITITDASGSQETRANARWVVSE